MSAEGKHPFEPGFAIWTDTQPDAFERVIAARACAKQPLAIYLVPHMPDALAVAIGEHAAWIRAAGKQWGVELEPRVVVRLPEKRPYRPWPVEATDELKAWSKEVFAIEGEGRLERFQPQARAAFAGCPAIGERMTAGVDAENNSDALLGVPRGLADCGCLGVDYDEVVGIAYLLGMITTEVAWIPANATSTTRAIPPLECGNLQPIAMRREDSWEGSPPPNLEEVVAEPVNDVDECAQQQPIDAAGLFSLTIAASEVGETTLEASLRPLDGHRGFSDFDRCVYYSQKLDVPAKGSTSIDFYVPAREQRAPE